MNESTSGAVRLCAIVADPLDVAGCLTAVSGADVGGTALFVGTVRDHDSGRSVRSLEYEAHPRAEVEMHRVLVEVAQQPGVRAVAGVHRVGDLRIGDLAVVVAVGAGHRGEAFSACRALIDRIKSEVPIWKRQVFSDGTEEWVAACAGSEVTT